MHCYGTSELCARRQRFHKIYAWQVALLASGLFLPTAATTSCAAETMQATSSAAARHEAMRAIPLKKIAAPYDRFVRQVLSDCSVYRRLPTQMVDCNPKLFTFLAQNPETLVEIWRQLGITRVDMERTGANAFRLTDNSGTTGKLVIVEQKCDDLAQNRIVMYAEGAYEGRPFRDPLKAQCVLLLRSGSIVETNNRRYVATRLDSFLSIDHASVELFAKVVHPLVGRTADRNFADTVQFIGNLSHEAETRPATVERLVSSLPRVSHQRQGELVQIAYQCAQGEQ